MKSIKQASEKLDMEMHRHIFKFAVNIENNGVSTLLRWKSGGDVQQFCFVKRINIRSN